MIFIEKDEPLDYSEIEKKFEVLKEACATGDDDAAREALRSVVPTFVRPEQINNASELERTLKKNSKAV